MLHTRRSYARITASSSNASTIYIGPPSCSPSKTFLGVRQFSLKTLRALAKFEFRGMQELSARWKLAVLNVRFPRHDNDAIKHADQLYYDLLDISRSDRYDTKARHRALRIVLKQVKTRNIQRLTQVLIKLPAIESELFASGFMYEPYVLLPGAKGTSNTWAISSLVQQDFGWDDFCLPLFNFICELVRLNESTYQLLALGFFDMVLILCFRRKEDRSEEALRICNSTLSSCAASYPGSAEDISDHPLSKFWPSWSPFLMRDPPNSSCSPDASRVRAWRGVSKQVMSWRLLQISKWLKWWESADPQTVVDDDELLEMSIDLVALSSFWPKYDPIIDQEASQLFEQFVTNGQAFQRAYDTCSKTILPGLRRDSLFWFNPSGRARSSFSSNRPQTVPASTSQQTQTNSLIDI